MELGFQCLFMNCIKHTGPIRLPLLLHALRNICNRSRDFQPIAVSSSQVFRATWSGHLPFVCLLPSYWWWHSLTGRLKMLSVGAWKDGWGYLKASTTLIPNLTYFILFFFLAKKSEIGVQSKVRLIWWNLLIEYTWQSVMFSWCRSQWNKVFCKNVVIKKQQFVMQTGTLEVV